MKVITAYSGEEGLRKAAETFPDLIVLDIRLPDISGIEVCKKLKSEAQFRIIPIIVFSVDNIIRNITAAYDVGADYYLIKDQNAIKVLEVLIKSVFLRRHKKILNISRKDSEVA